SAQYRTMGSLAFTAASRAVWGLAQDREDPERRLLLPIKNNLGPPSRGLAFRIQDAKVEWDLGGVTTQWKEAVGRPPKEKGKGSGRGRPPTARNRISQWLIESLREGEQPANQMWELAKANG